MDCLEAIMTRRSIRSYTDEPVTDAQVETILRAAMAAPSAGNRQSWRMIVIRDAEMRARLAATSQYAGMLPSAQVGIVVCGDTSAELNPGNWITDCSAAMENAVLAAHAMGLGAVWLGVYPREERMQAVTELLGLPEQILPLSMIALGHPADSRPEADRYNSEYVRRERW
jgi:nitroreductase